MTKIEYLFRQFETTLCWYKQSEEKAKFLVGINTLIVGAVNSLVFVGADKMRTVRDDYTMSIWVLLCLSGIALVASYFFIFLTMWPRQNTRDSTLKNTEKMWFFGDIASMSPDEHRNTMNSWTEDNVETTMVAQNYILSKNVLVKHDAINWAIALTILALVLLFGLGLAYGIAVTNTSSLPHGN